MELDLLMPTNISEQPVLSKGVDDAHHVSCHERRSDDTANFVVFGLAAVYKKVSKSPKSSGRGIGRVSSNNLAQHTSCLTLSLVLVTRVRQYISSSSVQCALLAVVNLLREGSSFTLDQK